MHIIPKGNVQNNAHMAYKVTNKGLWGLRWEIHNQHGRGSTEVLSVVALAKALHTTPNYLLMGETEEDPWMEDVMQVLSEIKDPTMRKLSIDQLKCIARIS